MENNDDLLAGSNILIVDDTRDNIFALSAFLETYGANIDSATNGREAFNKIREKKFDIILMDIRMPEMDGYEAIGLIRSHVETAKLPVIAVTAQAMPGDADKLLKAGADDYISKPIDTDLLVEKMKKILMSAT